MRDYKLGLTIPIISFPLHSLPVSAQICIFNDPKKLKSNIFLIYSAFAIVVKIYSSSQNDPLL